VILAGVTAFAVVGATPSATPAAALSAQAAAPTPAARVRASPSIDAAALEGASALARTDVVIPPPRWLVNHSRPETHLRTARIGGLGWQTDPYEK
jgi:hypothetical protein